MNSNQTAFTLVLGDDWRASVDARGRTTRDEADRNEINSQFVLRTNGALALRAQAQLFRLQQGDTAASDSLRSGACADRRGNLYVIEGAGLRLWICDRAPETTWFWFPGDPAAPTGAEPPLRGCAITSDDLLVVGRGAQLLVFDLVRGGAPGVLALPPGMVVTDLASAGHTVWILDAAARTACRLHIGDAVVPPDDAQLVQVLDVNAVPPVAPGADAPPAATATASPFAPCAASGKPVGRYARFDPPVNLPVDVAPIAITVLADGDAVVLSPAANKSLVRVNGGLGATCDFAELSAQFGAVASNDSLIVGHDLVAAGETLYVVDQRGNQVFVFDVRDAGFVLTADVVPLHSYAGHDLVVRGTVGNCRQEPAESSATTVTAAEADLAARQLEVVYLGGVERRWLPIAWMHRERFASSGSLQLPAAAGSAMVTGFDGGVPECVWDRLCLDACMPSGVTVRVATRAADRLEDLAGKSFQSEPELLRRASGPELPHRGQLHAVPTSTWEVLLQRAVGRYLQLHLEVTTELVASPLLFALRLWRPRFSLPKHYLPRIFGEHRWVGENGEYGKHDKAADFLERFLANPGGVFTDIEDRVAEVQRLFSPQRLAPEFLPWLAGWFGVALDDGWDTYKRRFFLANVMRFFACRGTVAGVRAAVRMLLEPCPTLAIFNATPDGVRIVEGFAQRSGFSAGAATMANDEAFARWVPAMGLEALQKRFLDEPGSANATFAPSPPIAVEAAIVWRRFCRRHLGFVPAATGADRARFVAFLARRYPDAATPSPWQLPPVVAADQPLFTTLSSATLADWYEFEKLVLPIATSAHRFTVVLPTPDRRALANDPGLAARTRDAVRRVVEIAKPAHTAFDVAFADQWFRAEEVRVGIDTVLGAPERTGSPPFFLDRDVLGDASLAAAMPVSPHDEHGRFFAPVPWVVP